VPPYLRVQPQRDAHHGNAPLTKVGEVSENSLRLAIVSCYGPSLYGQPYIAHRAPQVAEGRDHEGAPNRVERNSEGQFTTW